VEVPQLKPMFAESNVAKPLPIMLTLALLVPPKETVSDPLLLVWTSLWVSGLLLPSQKIQIEFGVRPGSYVILKVCEEQFTERPAAWAFLKTRSVDPIITAEATRKPTSVNPA